ncbi:hypothetical protein FBZ81_104450 [Azospirillum brasilense]|nr:hypothetical protein OH82_02346 [Azospirillum brasilense]TWB83534.1 hypothetical protein FBZ81_104450 [Azospirillum brasilense]
MRRNRLRTDGHDLIGNNDVALPSQDFLQNGWCNPHQRRLITDFRDFGIVDNLGFNSVQALSELRPRSLACGGVVTEPEIQFNELRLPLAANEFRPQSGCGLHRESILGSPGAEIFQLLEEVPPI